MKYTHIVVLKYKLIFNQMEIWKNGTVFTLNTKHKYYKVL
jgi:hypothetical protein